MRLNRHQTGKDVHAGNLRVGDAEGNALDQWGAGDLRKRFHRRDLLVVNKVVLLLCIAQLGGYDVAHKGGRFGDLDGVGIVELFRQLGGLFQSSIRRLVPGHSFAHLLPLLRQVAHVEVSQ